MLVPLFLPLLLLLLLLLEVIIPVTSRLNSVTVISFKDSKKTRNGPEVCALDTANETMSSSINDCTLKCARDATCTGFNMKNSSTCDVYNYKPKITAPVSDCDYHEVSEISNFFISLPDSVVMAVGADSFKKHLSSFLDNVGPEFFFLSIIVVLYLCFGFLWCPVNSLSLIFLIIVVFFCCCQIN